MHVHGAVNIITRGQYARVIVVTQLGCRGDGNNKTLCGQSHMLCGWNCVV